MTGSPVIHSAWIGNDGSAGAAGASSRLFPWWSFTKSALAVAALRLVEQGRLDLDAPRPGKPYTLRQLLQHRAGVPDYTSLAGYRRAVARGEVAWPRQQMLEAVGADRLEFSPGAGWSYSNTGYVFVGDAIEQASGLSLAEALASLVLEPLGLSSARLATFPDDFDGVFWRELKNYDPRWVYHGCLVGTPVEAASLLHSLVSGKILRPETLQTMLERFHLGGALPGRPWTLCGYGLGLMCGEAGDAGTAIGHSGGGPFGTNAVYHFPSGTVPVTVAAFAGCEDEGLAEVEAVSVALRMSFGSPSVLHHPENAALGC